MSIFKAGDINDGAITADAGHDTVGDDARSNVHASSRLRCIAHRVGMTVYIS